MTRLSPREVEVARLVAAGKDNNEIARSLTIAPRTVTSYIVSIQQKIGADNRVKICLWWLASTNPNLSHFIQS